MGQAAECTLLELQTILYMIKKCILVYVIILDIDATDLSFPLSHPHRNGKFHLKLTFTSITTTTKNAFQNIFQTRILHGPCALLWAKISNIW